jgi:hypothetical protein
LTGVQKVSSAKSPFEAVSVVAVCGVRHWPKADMPFCTAHPAFDPKRTCANLEAIALTTISLKAR